MPPGFSTGRRARAIRGSRIVTSAMMDAKQICELRHPARDRLWSMGEQRTHLSNVRSAKESRRTISFSLRRPKTMCCRRRDATRSRQTKTNENSTRMKSNACNRDPRSLLMNQFPAPLATSVSLASALRFGATPFFLLPPPEATISTSAPLRLLPFVEITSTSVCWVVRSN